MGTKRTPRTKRKAPQVWASKWCRSLFFRVIRGVVFHVFTTREVVVWVRDPQQREMLNRIHCESGIRRASRAELATIRKLTKGR